MNPLLDTLRATLGSAHVLHDSFDIAPYCSDWRGRYSGQPLCVVKPGSVAEVAAVVRSCAASGVAIVPQGGNTSLCGGATPLGPARRPDGEVLISLTRLNRVQPMRRDPRRRGTGPRIASQVLEGSQHGHDRVLHGLRVSPQGPRSRAGDHRQVLRQGERDSEGRKEVILRGHLR